MPPKLYCKQWEMFYFKQSTEEEVREIIAYNVEWRTAKGTYFEQCLNLTS